jgi:uncharacterized membrane protein
MSTSANLAPDRLILQGWKTLKRRPGLCIGMCLIYGIVQPGGGGGGGGGSGGAGGGSTEAMALIGIIIAGALLITLVQCVVAGPIRGGYDLAMLRLVRGDDSVTFGDLFAGFSKFVPLLLTFLLVGVCVLTGLVLCIVPGIIVMLGLWPAYLLVMEDDLPPVEAVKGAWALTNGHKVDLFILALANCVVILIGLLACCVGVLVAAPVAQLSWMGAYHEMRLAAGAAAASPSEPEPAPPSDPTLGLPPPAPAPGPGDELAGFTIEKKTPTVDEPGGE